MLTLSDTLYLRRRIPLHVERLILHICDHAQQRAILQQVVAYDLRRGQSSAEFVRTSPDLVYERCRIDPRRMPMSLSPSDADQKV